MIIDRLPNKPLEHTRPVATPVNKPREAQSLRELTRCQTMSLSVRGELTEKKAVDPSVTKFIPFILGNTGVNTSVLLGVKCPHRANPTLRRIEKGNRYNEIAQYFHIN